MGNILICFVSFSFHVVMLMKFPVGGPTLEHVREMIRQCFSNGSPMNSSIKLHVLYLKKTGVQAAAAGTHPVHIRVSGRVDLFSKSQKDTF